MTTKTTVRLVSVLLCALSAAMVLVVVKRSQPEGGSVQMVEGGGDLSRVLRERAGEAEAIPGTHRAAGEDDEALLVYFPVGRQLAANMYPSLAIEVRSRNPRKLYCPQAHFVNAPGWEARMGWREHPSGGWLNQYSQAGFRNPYEPAETPPDLRILLTGDSHIEAVVPYEETVAALLEMNLRSIPKLGSVEVLNGASGGYDFYNYLGLLERSLHLEPDIYLVIVYGGNDFIGALPLHGYYKRLELELRSPRWSERLGQVYKEHGQAVAQTFHQVTHLADRPQHVELAYEAAVLTLREMQRICDREGILLMTAYLPSQLEVRPQDMQASIDRISEVFELTREDLAVNDRLANRLIAELRTHGIEMIDLRRAMRAEGQRLFWQSDHHLNTRGQYVVARELMRHLRPVLARKLSGVAAPRPVQVGLER